jgi:hypothetical protein
MSQPDIYKIGPVLFTVNPEYRRPRLGSVRFG